MNLIGEHTDYSGGLALPAAIQLGITVRVRETAETIELASTLHGPAAPFAADGSGAPPGGWARYGHAVAAELAALGRPSVGLAGTVESSLPAGAGLSSSAALEVSLALALCAVAGFELEPLELALACRRAELRAVGVPCGILDQAASVLGRPDAAILLDCGTLAHRAVAVPPSAAFVIVDSGVRRSLEQTAYAQRRAELERALAAVGAESSTAVPVDAIERLDEVGARRVRHVVTENERVVRFVEALGRTDLAGAGRLLDESHASLRDDYEVSTAELDALVALAGEEGAYGARLLGAGFGGAVLALADADRAEALGHAVVDRYAGDGRSLVVHASAGAEVRRR